MWLSTMKALPLASQEASGAIETYHAKLKTKLFDDSHLNALWRVDWLVHKLTTELHSSYWLDRYADESDSFQNVKEEYITSTSWHRAMQIPDSAITFDEKDHLYAKVQSQKDSSVTHCVWNPGSEFAFCDCPWSMQANLCKHVIKVNMICENRQGNQSSMSMQSFREILLNIWKMPLDDSLALDLSMAWTYQMLDQIQKLVELNSTNDIGTVVNRLPIQWLSKKTRTSVCIPSATLGLPSSSKDSTRLTVALKKNRKRKRLSRLRWQLRQQGVFQHRDKCSICCWQTDSFIWIHFRTNWLRSMFLEVTLQINYAHGLFCFGWGVPFWKRRDDPTPKLLVHPWI